MGNTIFIRNKRVCVKSLRSGIEAIQKLNPPTTIKECRSFAGMVNFISIFYPELQGLLKPIYDLCEKVDILFGEENNKKLLSKSKVGYKDPQYYMCQMGKEDFNCILIQASLQQVVLCIKSRMASQSVLPMPARECQKLLKTIPLQN